MDVARLCPCSVLQICALLNFDNSYLSVLHVYCPLVDPDNQGLALLTLLEIAVYVNLPQFCAILANVF